MKHLFLTVSIFTLLSTSSFATWQQDVADEVNLEVGQNKIIQKLTQSQDYTINLDEGSLTNTIAKIVKDKNKRDIGGGEIKPEDITFEARHQIVNTLDNHKTSHAPLGHGYYLTQNTKGALSTTSHYNPLVYPVFSGKGDRDTNDAFLPTTYRSNFLSKDLCDRIRYYSTSHNSPNF